MKNIMPIIEYLLSMLKRFWLFILIASVIGGALGGVVSRIIYQPEYEMTQAFTIELVENPGANQVTISESQLSKTVPSLLSSDVYMEYMAPIIKESGAIGRFKVTSLQSTNIFYLTVVARSNADAEIIIDSIQQHYGEIADNVLGESSMKFLAPPGYSALPINAPHYTMGVLIGILLGALIIIALLVIRALITVTVTSAQEIEDEINAKCLATISRVYIKKRSSKEGQRSLDLVTSDDADFDFQKSISTLSTGVSVIAKEKGYKTILVTSTISGEGKSTISLNLACDLADKGNRTLIVDCDFRTPSIAGYLGLEEIGVPISDAIRGNISDDIVCATDVDNLYFCGNIDGGATAFEDATSQRFKAIIDGLKSQFEYIILDSPPVGFLGDAISLCDVCDSYIYVVSYNSVSKSYILRSMSSLDDSRTDMLGFVLNGV